jgi:hypothetical protein
MYEDITELFCFIDDFYKIVLQEIAKILLADTDDPQKPTSVPTISDSEIITILILYQRSYVKNFKAFYTRHMGQYKKEFLKCQHTNVLYSCCFYFYFYVKKEKRWAM